MRDRLVRALFFLAILSVFAADVSVGCGQPYAFGPVDQKFRGGGEGAGGYVIVVDRATYEVPLLFYTKVQLGDIVRFDGHTWTIVKPATSPAPVSTP